MENDTWDPSLFKNAILITNKAEYVVKEKNYSKQNTDSCIICKIVRQDPDIPAYEIFRNRNFIIFLNLYPYTTGHIMISPLRHICNFEEFNSDELKELGIFIQKTLKILRKQQNAQSFNVGWNQGDVAGGSIKHYHVHIVPRYKNELNFMETIAHTRPIIQSLDDTHKQMIKYQPYYKGEKELDKIE